MKYFLIGMVTIFLVALLGCGQQSTAPDKTAGPAAVSTTIPPEAQKLLDDYIVPDGELSPEIVFNSFDPGANFTGYDVFSVTFLWGDIFGPSSDIAVTDWSGGLHVNGQGHVRVGYEIDFEPGEDYILPAVSVDHVQWVSYTAYDIDGINFLVYLSPVTTADVPISITFGTEPFTLTLTYRQLFKHAAFYRIDESRGVAVHSQIIWQNVCPGGTMAGKWIKETNDSNQGNFQGQWINHAGQPIGYMSGRFWTNEDGSRLFSGNVSGLDTDQVIAELSGIWAYDDPRLCPVCGDDHGYFRGRFHYIDGSNRRGYLKGIFGDYNLPPDQDTLPYFGVWRNYCPYTTLAEPDVSAE